MSGVDQNTINVAYIAPELISNYHISQNIIKNAQKNFSDLEWKIVLSKDSNGKFKRSNIDQSPLINKGYVSNSDKETKQYLDVFMNYMMNSLNKEEVSSKYRNSSDISNFYMG
ncbi:hypothetical protein K9L67_02335 [Candidatus Woesearchaeota archaeon]|nr:hypothetical protein [Candidatus Woesearchaeota archaeon]MCF7901043.1 hypothetical protein [Candidatus Woesearchaeota archaeon]MCF8013376.1 hypothetical protein [Candidatus Woesearchaeota archaeon]